MHLSTELGVPRTTLSSGARWALVLLGGFVAYAAFGRKGASPTPPDDVSAQDKSLRSGVVDEEVPELAEEDVLPWIDPESLPDLRADADRCRARIEKARLEPAFPGTPRLDARRAQVLARGKAEPVVFLEEPAFTGKVTPGIAAHRKRLRAEYFVRDATLELLTRYHGLPKQLRQLFLRNGYLYVDDAAAARELTTRLELNHLFTEPDLVVERGSERIQVKKAANGYVYASGPDSGRPATLLLFDRVWIEGEEPGTSLHVDVREFASREGTDAIRFERLGERSIVAELRYGDEWVSALIEREGPRLELGCLLVPPDDVARVGRARDAAFRRSQIVRSIQSAVVAQVQAGLPFDEPKTERGQQDGELRQRWEEAYFAGRSSFRFNRDKYQVFDAGGRPLAPQVCVDFVTETLERASGMHFTALGQKPEKVLGALDFDEILGGDRRKESALRGYAKLNPDRLALLDFPEESWVRYEDVGAFFRFIERNKDEMRAGDVVIIRGRAAWDHYRDLHTHTFFVYATDPMTGMPLLLAGNSGKPRIVTWDAEMLRAPRRSIQHRIRPNMEWLYDRVVLRSPLRGERWAAPLSVNRD